MADNGKTARSGGRESLRKVSISRIKKEMSDVFYLSDDLVISALTADKNTTADYPTSIDGFTAIIMMTGEATVSIDMQNYSIKPNTIVFFNPDSIIRTIKCSSNAAAYLLAFSKSFVNEIQIDLSTSLPVYMDPSGAMGNLLAIAACLVASFCIAAVTSYILTKPIEALSLIHI